MIKKKCFENNWIISKYKEIKADPKIKLDKKYLGKIKDVDLPDDLNIINKLKVISPESFYLWAITTKVI